MIELYKDPNWLRWKYSIERLNSSQIAEICNVSAPTIRDWLIKFGIERRNASERQRGKKYSPETIRRLRESHLGHKNTETQKKEISESLKKYYKKHPYRLKGRQLSEKHKKNIGKGLKEAYENEIRIPPNLGRMGEKSFSWKGGITPENMAIRSSEKYQEWRKLVFERDDYTCQKCKARNGNGKAICLHAHHILSFAKYPEKRFDLDNGITLCKDCHRRN